ncbi:MAG: tetratricopeptide repeat protein [Candidatus Cloacimonas sp.]|nr:tetratricopeptide repeat protein [Candidatus Cloacimonas sp.]
MKHKSALLPGMVDWTLQTAGDSSHSCSFGCGYLFLDVCGFTKLTEKVSAKGHYGVEVIINLLNQYFDMLNDKILAHGGQILKFEGDAVLAAFALPQKHCIEQLQACMQSFSHDLQILNESLEAKYGSSLAYHGSMGYGTSQMIILGSKCNHLDYIIYSPVLGKLYKLCDLAKINETLLVPEVIEDTGIGCPPVTIPQFADQGIDIDFFPELILQRGRDKDFSGELRNSAILFIGVDAEQFIHYQRYDEINNYYCAIQEIVYRLEGMLNKIDYTDKGMILLISFGILQTHVDDIERAITCANQINRINSPLKAKIGLTYSNLYAGILGAKNRHEYGIIGGGVNVASRLMSSAEYGQIVFTKDLLSSIETRFEVQFLRKTFVKGIKDEIEFYLIVREIPEYVSTYIKQFVDKQQVEYIAEIAEVVNSINAKKLNQVLLSGEHGTGKSFLGWQILKGFFEQGKSIAVFILDEFNRHDRLALLRKLIAKAMGCEDPIANLSALRGYLSSLIPDSDAEILINFLGAKGAEAQVLDDRGQKKELLLQSLLGSFNALIKSYDFLLIDNIQWLDDISAQVLEKRLALTDKMDQVLILTSLPTFQIMQSSNPRTVILNLFDLDHRAVSDLIRSRIPNITYNAADYIFNLAGGNPSFIIDLCEQISSYYPDPDIIITTPSIQEIENRGLLPYNVENLFMIKYESLSSGAKDILKKASIIGKGFTLGEIVETQAHIDNVSMVNVLNELKDKDIIGVTDLAPEVQYLFNNVLMRHAVYSTILLKEKRELHSRIASYYEDKYADRSEAYSELLAYHFHLGEDYAKALRYALVAAAQNQVLANHGESIYFYNIALQCTSIPCQAMFIKLSIVDSQFYLGEFETAMATLHELDEKTICDAEVMSKYHFLRSRAMYLSGDYEAVLEYLAPVTEFSGKYGDYTRIYQLDSLYKLYRMDEFNSLISQLKTDIGKLAAQELGLKGIKHSALLKHFSKLSPLEVNPQLKHYLYLLLKFETIQVANLIDTARYKEAHKSLTLQYELAKVLKDDLSLRIACGLLGVVYARQGDKKKAFAAYVEAIGIADRISDRFGYAKVLIDMGTLYRQMGDHKHAMQNYKRSLKIFEALNNLPTLSIIHHNIGELHHQEGHYQQAIKAYRKALRFAKKSGDLFGVSIENDAIGDILLFTNQLDKAKALYHKNLKLQKSIDDREGIAHTYGNLGNVAKYENDLPLALEYYDKNLKLTAEIGDLDGNGRGYFNLAGVYEIMGDFKKTKETLLEAKKRFEKAGLVDFLQQTNERLLNYPD